MDIHLEYLILTAFPWQQQLHKHASMLRFCEHCLPCLFFKVLHTHPISAPYCGWRIYHIQCLTSLCLQNLWMYIPQLPSTPFPVYHSLNIPLDIPNSTVTWNIIHEWQSSNIKAFKTVLSIEGRVCWYLKTESNAFVRENLGTMEWYILNMQDF